MGVFTQLNDILDFNEASLAEEFMESLDKIFQYGHQDIREVLLKLGLDSLGRLRRALCDRVVHDFPQYNERKVINRQVKNTIIPDILILGLTITNNIPAKDLDKIFQSPNKLSESASLTPDSKEGVVEKQVEDLASLLQIMLELRGRVDKLETEVRTIQGKEATDEQQSQPIATDAQNNSAHQATLGNQETRQSSHEGTG